MRKRNTLLTLVAVACGCGGAPVEPDKPVAPVEATVVTEAPPKQALLLPDVQHRRTKNGMDVYVLSDRKAPIVMQQFWFKVGSANEREARPEDTYGTTGLSHFFEHLMFRGTERYPSFDEPLMRRGAQLNAFTWHDETVYWESVPSEHLQTVIQMEADRLEHMRLDFLNLEPEREVVRSERLMRTENQPMGLAWERLQARMFERFPYHWKTIGWQRDLIAITLDEAEAYHGVYYAPNNAFLLVVGDFDPDQTLAWIRAAYGHLPRKDVPPGSFSPEPAQTAERHDFVVKPSDPPLVLVGYRAPAAADADYAVLEVIDQILTGGKAARLQRRLVYADAPRTSSLFAYLFPMRHPYMYLWGFHPQPGATAEEIAAIMDDEAARLARGDVGRDELERAVARLRSQVVRQNLSNRARGELLGFSLMATGDPGAFFDRLATYGSVTPDDVRRVAAQILRPQSRTIVPVVDPDRLRQLVALLAAASDPLPPGVAEASAAAVDLALATQDLAARRAANELEHQAIGLLEQRAAHHRQAARDDAEREAIDAYMREAESGGRKRLERLRHAQEELAATEAALATRRQDLRTRLADLRRARWNPSRVPVAYHLALADAVTARGPLKETPIVVTPAQDPLGVAQKAAYDAIVAWLLEAEGLARSAQERRAAVLAATDGFASESSEITSLTAAARSLAWDTQVTGRPLEDLHVQARPARARRAR